MNTAAQIATIETQIASAKDDARMMMRHGTMEQLNSAIARVNALRDQLLTVKTSAYVTARMNGDEATCAAVVGF